MKEHTYVCRLILLLILMLSICFCACAQQLDFNALSMDELINMQTLINEEIHARKRQFAIENGDRIITLDQKNVILFPRQTKKLTPSVERVVDDAPEKTSFVWSSSNDAVATVSTTGIITAIGEGETVITCSAADADHIFASIPVQVVLRVSKISLSEPACTLLLTSKDPSSAVHQLQAVLEPENAHYQKVIWTSSNTEVATVDANGLVQALKPGTTTITVTSTEPVAGEQTAKKAICKLTVAQAVESITLDESSLQIKKGSTNTLNATVIPQNATNKKLTWSSSDPSIVSVSATGQITAKSCGICTITCSATDGSDISSKRTIIVYQPVTSIKPEKPTLQAPIFIDSGISAVVNVTVSPADATNNTVSFSSSDSSIAVVDSSGNIFAQKPGTCKIICTANDGSGKSCEVTVNVPSISIPDTNITLTSKFGGHMPINYYGDDPSQITAISAKKSIVTSEVHIDYDNSITVHFQPEKSGSTTVTLKDGSGERYDLKINVTVPSYASYDGYTALPSQSELNALNLIPKDEISAAGSSILGAMTGETSDSPYTYQIYGRVFQRIDSYYCNYLIVNVGSRQVCVVCYPGIVDPWIDENKYVTVYGHYVGNKEFSRTDGSISSLPMLEAEMIKVGPKN